MTKSRFFFDDLPVYQAEWIKTIGTILQDGVICGIGNDLFVYGDASGMQVKVKSGRAVIKGQFFDSDAEETIPLLSVAPDTSGYYRYDLLVLETNWDADPNTMDLKIIEGIASATPSIPELTRTDTIWQTPLARIKMSYGDTNVANDNVLDLRRWALGTYTIPFVIGSGLATVSIGTIPVGVDIPGRGKIFRCSLKADVSGSIALDLWKDLQSNYPPTVADTICGTVGGVSQKPSLTAQQFASFSVWNEGTYPNENALYWPGYEFDLPDNGANIDSYVLLPNVDSVATIKQLNLTLWVARSADVFEVSE